MRTKTKKKARQPIPKTPASIQTPTPPIVPTPSTLPSPVEDPFADEKLLEQYLNNSTKLLKIIEEKTEEFLNTYNKHKTAEYARSAIILDLPLHYEELNAKSRDLLCFLAFEPTQFLEAAKYLIYSIVRKFVRNSSCDTETLLQILNCKQVHSRFRFMGLPLKEELIYDVIPNRYPSGLAVLTCVLAAYTEPVTYTIQSIWYCSRGCKSNLTKAEGEEAPSKCFVCTRPMSEYSKYRSMGEFRLLKVFPIASVATPRVFNKIFRAQVVHLKDYAYDCELSLGSKYAVTGHLDFAIPDDDLDDLLAFTQPTNIVHGNVDLPIFSQSDKTNENSNLTTDFQYHQNLDVPLHATDLFRDDGKVSTEKENPQNYPPEFDLSFSLGSPDPTLVITTQHTENIELSSSASRENKLEDSIFVHPQMMKDEPLDLSVPSLQFSSAASEHLEKHVLDDMEFEFTPDPESPSRFSFNTSSKPKVDEIDPYSIGPSTSRRAAEANLNTRDPNTSGQSTLPSSIRRSPTSTNSYRRSPIDFLTLSYSQTSLEDEGSSQTNTRAELHSSQNETNDLSNIPQSVLRLYETIKLQYSDFSFVYSLASQLCQDRVPLECFVHLKIGLMLSIASLEDNRNRPPLSVVAIGPEFDWANHLMENIGNCAQRFVDSHDGFKIPAPKKNSPFTWIECDSVVLAKGGIFYIGDWNRLRPARVHKMFKIVECGRVPVEWTKLSCPLESAIWTHWRAFKQDAKDKNTLSKFFEIFGVPLIVEEENHEVLVDLMLEQASVEPFESTIDELSICPDDVREYLSVVTKRKVDITEEAAEVLRKYFVASRLERPDCLTQKSYTSLKLFAESFAKLSMRHDVILMDAIAAIYMTELSLGILFGPGAFPPPKFKIHTYIGDVDEHMAKFQTWVYNYISQMLD